MNNEISKRLVEVYEILKCLPKKDYEKIPKDIIDSIIKNKSTQYTWKIDKSKKIFDQDINKETLSILAYLNMEYIVSKEQKDFLKKLYVFNNMKNN